MSIIENMKTRKSTRSYHNQPLAGHDIQKIENLISTINKTGPFGNTISYKLVILNDEQIKKLNKLINYGFFKGVPLFVAGIMEENANYYLDYGYLMEELVLKLTDLDFDTCWIGGSLNKSAFGKSLGLKKNEKLPCIISIGYRADREKMYHSFIRKSLKGHNRKPFSELFFKDSREQPLKQEEAGKYGTPLEMVRLAPSACNKQPWRIIKDGRKKIYHFYFVRDVKYSFSLKIRRLSDLQVIDIGIAMYHFEAAVQESGLIGEWIKYNQENTLHSKNFEYMISWKEKNA